MVSSASRIIVCEKGGRWAIALRGALARCEITVCETRSLPECRRELQQLPYGIVAIEVTSVNCDDVLRCLVDWTVEFPDARFLVLGQRELASCEATLREAGAAHVQFGPTFLDATGRLIRNHWLLAPRPEVGLERSIWDRLPWQRTTSGQ